MKTGMKSSVVAVVALVAVLCLGTVGQASFSTDREYTWLSVRTSPGTARPWRSRRGGGSTSWRTSRAVRTEQYVQGAVAGGFTGAELRTSRDAGSLLQPALAGGILRCSTGRGRSPTTSTDQGSEHYPAMWNGSNRDFWGRSQHDYFNRPGFEHHLTMWDWNHRDFWRRDEPIPYLCSHSARCLAPRVRAGHDWGGYA